MKAALKQIKEIKSLHAEKGLNAVYGYIKRNNISVEIKEHHFGFGHHAVSEKHDFLNEKTNKRELRFHYCDIMKSSRRNGYKANLLRAISFIF